MIIHGSYYCNISAANDTVSDGASNRPRHASARYEPGEAIIDTATCRSSSEVLIAKNLVAQKQDEALALQEEKKITQHRAISALEDNLKVQNNNKIVRAVRPDLVDLEPIQEKVC